ncbi:hypothetical protein appser6_4890 [Actinobacillus pleuropneumoniae serovar 6 str. Femo]|uniref:Uncharacterized protein n=1 Tax=Actinobacillus pleuropneumoniae serovar 6 str. Femo TaxID=754256 RepID=A0A828PNF6_ACTPL|nr:hypothetical protein appser6_4890 [Actinobacillus pleuropneumoniae serovar 6 str. Femo]
MNNGISNIKDVKIESFLTTENFLIKKTAYKRSDLNKNKL